MFTNQAERISTQPTLKVEATKLTWSRSLPKVRTKEVTKQRSSHNAQQGRPEQKAPLDDAFDIDVDELLEMLDVEGEYLGFTL